MEIDFNKLVEKVENIPVKNWKNVETTHKEAYYSPILGGYKALIYRNWVVEHGKPEWTGGNCYGLSIVKDPKFPWTTELCNFETKRMGRLFQKVSEFHYMENQKKTK